MNLQKRFAIKALPAFPICLVARGLAATRPLELEHDRESLAI